MSTNTSLSWRMGIFFGVCLTLQPVFGSSPNERAIRDLIQCLQSYEECERYEAIEALSATRDQRLTSLFRAYNQGAVYVWDERQVAICADVRTEPLRGKVANLRCPLSGDRLTKDGQDVVAPIKQLRGLVPNRTERRAVGMAIRRLEIWSTDADTQLAAIKRLGNSREPQFAAALEELLASSPSRQVARRARESLLLIRVSGHMSQPFGTKVGAIRDLGAMRSARAVPVLMEILNDSNSTEIHAAALRALDDIEHYQRIVRYAQNLFNGISLGSILVLMALGLSIIFGQMGVINMAHGELMMIGAYATYEMQLLFGATPDNPSGAYFLVAIPFSFVVAATFGYVIERLVIRQLYDRPLETLLATWGVGLVLVQLARVKYGDNIGINAPSWLIGAVEPIQDLVIPYNRAFILGLCMACVLGLRCLLHYTRLGLLMRATVQGRQVASTLGVPTDRVDAYTFALGAGLAGVAGCAWTLVGGVTPDMGQNHIVDSFLVVVTGGVGKLVGTVVAGLGIGSLNKVLEPMSFSHSLVLVGAVTFVGCWAMLVWDAFRYHQRWGWASFVMPIPIPLFFVLVNRRNRKLRSVTAGYCMSLAAVIVGSLVSHPWMMQQIRSIWAKVLILLCVVVFIQWKPLGLFPPKGRLVDA